MDLLLGTTTAAEALNRVLTLVDVDSAALLATVDLFPGRADQIGPLPLTLMEKITRSLPAARGRRPGRPRPRPRVVAEQPLEPAD